MPRPPGAKQRELTLGVGEGRATEQHGEEQQVVARDGERAARELRAYGGHRACSCGERNGQQDGQGTNALEVPGEDEPQAGHDQQHACVHRDAQFLVQGEDLPAIPCQRKRRRGVIDHACG